MVFSFGLKVIWFPAHLSKLARMFYKDKKSSKETKPITKKLKQETR